MPSMPEVEEINRQPHTRDWFAKISETRSEALPIKNVSGKVVRITRVTEAAEDGTDNEDDIGSQDEAHDIGDSKIKSKKKKKKASKVEEDGEGSKPFEKKNNQCKTLVYTGKSPKELDQCKRKIAEICNSIISSPSLALKQRGTTKEKEKEKGTTYYMSDLLDIMVHTTDAEEFEMTMLSTLLVFKDICPGYRIRSPEEFNKDVQLKKETKHIRDFEVALLVSYQKYISLLEGKVQLGLGGGKRQVEEWGFVEKLGLSALRCQCELLRNLHYFNFRSAILKTVILRSCQPEDSISSICCDTLVHLFKHDATSDLSYEAVKIIAITLSATKSNLSAASLIKTLEHVKIAIHADQAKDIRLKAKRERRKRKRHAEDAEAGLVEASLKGDKNSKLRFQADSLQELSLIYFRIIKAKVRSYSNSYPL